MNPATKTPETKQSPHWFTANQIAFATGASKKAVHRTAVRESWLKRANGNLYEYQVPPSVRTQCLKQLQNAQPAKGLRGFNIPPEFIADKQRADHRFAAVLALQSCLAVGKPFEKALAHVAHVFHTNQVSLRKWAGQVAKLGFAGVLDHRRGNSGRKASQGKAR